MPTRAGATWPRKIDIADMAALGREPERTSFLLAGRYYAIEIGHIYYHMAGRLARADITARPAYYFAKHTRGRRLAQCRAGRTKRAQPAQKVQ